MIAARTSDNRVRPPIFSADDAIGRGAAIYSSGQVLLILLVAQVHIEVKIQLSDFIKNKGAAHVARI